MTDERTRQRIECQWQDGIHFVTLAIFHGSWSYERFLATNPDVKAKKYVDDWLKAHLALPEYKGKIIPGFNDK